jgi:hypothetical protein
MAGRKRTTYQSCLFLVLPKSENHWIVFVATNLQIDTIFPNECILLVCFMLCSRYNSRGQRDSSKYLFLLLFSFSLSVSVAYVDFHP